jgi:hypothetical protein
MIEPPVIASSTVTLHGRKRPISGVFESALYASGGLQAPRILYGQKSSLSFDFSVDLTSISFRTPKPSVFNASITRLLASLKVKLSCTSMLNVLFLMGILHVESFFIYFLISDKTD